MKVAVIDTGVDLSHPMLSGKLAPSTEWWDYVDNDNSPQDVSGGEGYGHGTVVSTLILQVAPQATILPLRVLASNGLGDLDDVAAAIDRYKQRR
ncbi:MAG: S8 family serine peptidase [Deinococcales bacterium]